MAVQGPLGCLQMHISLFTLVDSGVRVRALSEWANNMNDLMTGIISGKEQDLHVKERKMRGCVFMK